MTRTGKRPRKTTRRRSVTIRDVARRAGVSTATVSRTIAAPHLVAEGTRALVTAAIRETSFTPNATARSLRAKSTKMVMALIPGLDNSFFSPILNALEAVLSEAGYGLIIGDTRDSATREAHYARLIRAGQVDGLALFTGKLPRDGDYVIDVDRVPTALICNEIPGESRLSLFDVADREASRIAVEHLIACGHRRIAFIAGPPSNIEAGKRRVGYRDALRAAGLAADSGLIWGGSFLSGAGIKAGTRYLASADRPTAVVAACDESAIAFIRTLRDAGLGVPAEVSVVGFDDLDHAGIIDPPLTTMRQPRADLGRSAATDLLRRLTSGDTKLPPTRVRFDCKLIVRDSVRAIEHGKRPPKRRPRPDPGVARIAVGASDTGRS